MPAVLSFDVGIRNLAYCLVEGEQGSPRVLKWDVLDVHAKDIEAMSSKLVGVLYDLFAEDDISQVLIENQPVMKNPTMKSVQMIIYSFFICTRELGMSSIGRVGLVPASCKNKFCEKVLAEEAPDESPASYARNKRRAVQTTRKLVPEAWRAYFEAHKKKDDLADAFLQALCKM